MQWQATPSGPAPSDKITLEGIVHFRGYDSFSFSLSFSLSLSLSLSRSLPGPEPSLRATSPPKWTKSRSDETSLVVPAKALMGVGA